MLFQCWPNVEDGGPTLKQHWVNVPYFLGYLLFNSSAAKVNDCNVTLCYQGILFYEMTHFHWLSKGGLKPHSFHFIFIDFHLNNWLYEWRNNLKEAVTTIWHCTEALRCLICLDNPAMLLPLPLSIKCWSIYYVAAEYSSGKMCDRSIAIIINNWYFFGTSRYQIAIALTVKDHGSISSRPAQCRAKQQ